jgi:hypothetical protein
MSVYTSQRRVQAPPTCPWLAKYIPRPTPSFWHRVQVAEDGISYQRDDRRMSVIISGSVEADGKRWVHFSVARPDRLPAWDELVRVKEQFLGAETTAIQVFAPRSKWINIHERCFHLWVCAEVAPVVPDFARGGASI